jgi:hypothetical protein
MWRRVLVVWSASRVAVLSLGYLLTAELGWHRALQPWQTKWVGAVTGWDSVFYIRISHIGYRPGKLEAFFPLYPIGIWAVRNGLEVGDAVAALLVSNLAVLAALVGMYVLARDRLSEDHARRSILYLVLSPYAFALTMAYSEGPFLAFTVWMFVLSDREHDLAAAPLGYAAGLTRVTGLALVAPLALRAWRRRTVSAWLLAAAPAAAFATQAAWLQHAVGDPLGMVHVQAQWGGHPAFPLISLGDQFWRFATTRDFFFLARGVTVIAYLALLVPLFRQERFRATRAEDVLLVCGIFALPLLSSVLQSVGRFGLVAFPLMFAMADIGLRRESWHRAYVVFAPTAQIVFFTAVALGYRPP